jgi:hypothetical protein
VGGRLRWLWHEFGDAFGRVPTVLIEPAECDETARVYPAPTWR